MEHHQDVLRFFYFRLFLCAKLSHFFPQPQRKINWGFLSNGILRPPSWHSPLMFGADLRSDFCHLINYSDTFWVVQGEKKLLNFSSFPKDVLICSVLIPEDRTLPIVSSSQFIQLVPHHGISTTSTLMHQGVMSSDMWCSPLQNSHLGDPCA